MWCKLSPAELLYLVSIFKCRTRAAQHWVELYVIDSWPEAITRLLAGETSGLHAETLQKSCILG